MFNWFVTSLALFTSVFWMKKASPWVEVYSFWPGKHVIKAVSENSNRHYGVKG
jgi:hypothetical protein